jgi:DNA-binding transcriptional ArsR family regulator
MTHSMVRYTKRGNTVGCTTCVDRPAADVQIIDGELRPSLRQHQTPDITAAVALAALVAEPVRAGILAILRDGPHCVCEMAAALDVKQNNLSNHLAKLREAGLVRASRNKVDARWRYYERDEDAISVATEALRQVL